MVWCYLLIFVIMYKYKYVNNFGSVFQVNPHLKYLNIFKYSKSGFFEAEVQKW